MDTAEPGAIHYPDDPPSDIFLRCPGCGEASALAIGLDGIKPDGAPSWGHTGPLETPTLTPSIHHDTPACGWHGWLRDGVFAS